VGDDAARPVSRRVTVARRDGAVVLTFLPAEVQVLQWVFDDLGRMLSGESTYDAVTKRLFPRAYLDPTAEESEAQWQEMVHDELVETRLTAMADVVQSLDDAVRLRGRDEAREIVLDAERAERWLTVLNDARLAVGTALGISPEWDFAELDPEDPNFERHAVYAWMTELQSALVEAVAG
jgi:hypothetical protein